MLAHPGKLRASTGRLALMLASVCALASSAAATTVEQTNLVTDDQAFLTGQGFSAATTVDPGLINPWGVSSGPTSPFWVSNQGSGTSTLYNGAGAKIPLTVTIAGSPGPSGPTGQVFNGGSGFALSGGGSARSLFASLDGSISGWNGGTVAESVVPANNGAIYTGLALGDSGGASYLYAPNAVTGKIDVFDSNFAPASLAGSFVDPGANPDGLVPFNVQQLGGKLYVSYAVPGADQDEAALGSGFVSVFNTDGTFDRRLATGGVLSSPWGMAIAPAGFDGLGGALLVGNFSEGFGTINAFSLTDGALLGTLKDRSGAAITIPYLWALQVGNGGAGGLADQLYFSAGIGDEQHGLFGTFAAVPEPAAWAMMILGMGLIGTAQRRRRMSVAAA